MPVTVLGAEDPATLKSNMLDSVLQAADWWRHPSGRC